MSHVGYNTRVFSEEMLKKAMDPPHALAKKLWSVTKKILD